MMKEYLDRYQASRLTGFTFSNLQYHARRGNVRTIRQLQYEDRGCFRYLYHIDDLRLMTWPGVYDIAENIDVLPNTLSKMVGRFNIEGAVKIGGRWRFPPEIAKKVEGWAKSGYPVMKGFTPKRFSNV